MKRQKLAIVLIAALAVAMLYPRCARFLAQDSCLDGGGRWNPVSERCER